MSLAEKTRVAVWASWALLLAVQVIEVWQRQAPWIIWLGMLLPLLIFAPGMLKDNLRSYIWLCFVSLLYFMRLVIALFAQPDSALAITGMFAVVVLFISAMMYVRWRARELRDAAAAGSGHGE
jgi:uncharacterized membrane protein